MRSASLERNTKETRIQASLRIEGRGRYEIATGIRFLDHMLELFSKHGGFDLKLAANGDLDVDQHHTVEDAGIVLGQLFSKALGDRMEMAHSIEGRVPFLDYEVVEVICSQPVTQKIRGMTEKYVLREAVRDVITDTVYRRQKHPFLSPPATLNPNEKLSTLVQDTLRGTVFATMPFFDQNKVVRLLDNLNKMDEGSQVAIDQVLMILTSACVLQKGFQLAA